MRRGLVLEIYRALQQHESRRMSSKVDEPLGAPRGAMHVTSFVFPRNDDEKSAVKAHARCELKYRDAQAVWARRRAGLKAACSISRCDRPGYQLAGGGAFYSPRLTSERLTGTREQRLLRFQIHAAGAVDEQDSREVADEALHAAEERRLGARFGGFESQEQQGGVA